MKLYKDKKIRFEQAIAPKTSLWFGLSLRHFDHTYALDDPFAICEGWVVIISVGLGQMIIDLTDCK